MKSDVDNCLKEIARYFIRHKKALTEPKLKKIMVKHCENEQEIIKFYKFLETILGQLRFKTLLHTEQEILRKERIQNVFKG